MSKPSETSPPAYTSPFQLGQAAYNNGHPLQPQPYTTFMPAQEPQPSYQNDVDRDGPTRVILVEERQSSGDDVLLGCCAGCAAACCCFGCVVM